MFYVLVENICVKGFKLEIVHDLLISRRNQYKAVLAISNLNDGDLNVHDAQSSSSQARFWLDAQAKK